MQPQNLFYSTHQNYPELYWEVPHTPFHNDLYFHYKAANDSALQLYKMIDGTHENHQGISSILSIFFLSFCRTFIFIKTFYLPNYLSSKALWQMCIYADTHLHKYSYLIEQFPTDLFSYLDYHRNAHHKLSQLNIEDIAAMKILTEKLMKELRDLVIVGGLLTHSEKKSVSEIPEQLTDPN